MPSLAPASRFGRRFRSLLWKPSLDDEIADEIAFHLEMRARDYAARGLTPASAAAAARQRFGDLGQVQAACRAIGRGRDRAERRGRWLAETAQDLRLAGRRLGDWRGSSLLAVLALAVGLASAATAWRVSGAVLLPPPVVEPERLVRLRQLNPQGVDFAVSPADYVDWRRRNRSCAGMAAFEALEANLQDGELPAQAPERVLAVHATASLLPLLGVRPWLGRSFSVAETARGGEHQVVVLSHALWWRRFAGDPRVVGRTLRLDGQPMRVIGVMPPGFEAPLAPLAPPAQLASLATMASVASVAAITPMAAMAPLEGAVWLPLAGRGPLYASNRDHHRLEVLGRLRPEIAPRGAAADLAGVAAEVARLHPDTNRGWGVELEPLPVAWAGARWTQRARLLLAAAGLLWLLATASAANLLWARATARQKEIDLRAALGGGRGRIIRQLLAEGVLVSLLGAVAALLLAGAATFALRRAAVDLPQLAALGGRAATVAFASTPQALAALPRLDLGSAGLVLALALISSLACSLGPVLQVLRPGLHEAVRQSARLTVRHERRVRDALVVVELAMATTLLVAAGLLLESYLRLDRADPGFDPDHVLTSRLALNGGSYPPARRRELLRQIESSLSRLPGVAAAGFTSTAPLAAERPAEPFTLGAEFLAAEWRVVTPGTFQALGLRRVAGRLLEAGDRDGGHPVAVVDATLAARCWPGRNPLGRRLRWTARGRDLTVVGVVDGLSDLDLEAGPRPVVFVPYEVAPWRAMALVVRPQSGIAALADLAAAVRRQVAALDPNLPLAETRLLEVARRQAVAGPRLGTWLLALFAAAALALAVSGVYATAASAVARRTAELAVRQALGANARDVLRLVLGRSAALTAGGLALGMAGALAFSRLLRGQLFDLPATHLAAYAGAALLLAGVALVATAFPARRAIRIPAILALRRE